MVLAHFLRKALKIIPFRVFTCFSFSVVQNISYLFVSNGVLWKIILLTPI